MGENSGSEDIGVTLFKRAGICLLDIQAVEKGLSLLLLPTQTLKGGNPSKKALDETRRMLWTMSIGKLQRLCAHLLTKDRQFMVELESVRKLRNNFVHDFFTGYMERIPQLTKATEGEIQEMIDELDALHKRLIRFHERLTKITKQEYKGFQAAIKARFDSR
jgi:hypothetical protein